MKIRMKNRTVTKYLNRSSMNERERQVFRLRFGLNNQREILTLEEIGKIFGVTRERIRQIEAKALAKIRYEMKKEDFTLEDIENKLDDLRKSNYEYRESKKDLLQKGLGRRTIAQLQEQFSDIVEILKREYRKDILKKKK